MKVSISCTSEKQNRHQQLIRETYNPGVTQLQVWRPEQVSLDDCQKSYMVFIIYLQFNLPSLNQEKSNLPGLQFVIKTECVLEMHATKIFIHRILIFITKCSPFECTVYYLFDESFNLLEEKGTRLLDLLPAKNINIKLQI